MTTTTAIAASMFALSIVFAYAAWTDLVTVECVYLPMEAIDYD